MQSYEFYKKTDPDKMILRDYLAFDRTILANYRTMLAFYRTALASFGAGLTLIEVFKENATLVVLGAVAIGVSVLCVLYGSYSFISTKKRLRDVYNKDAEKKA